MIEEFNQSLKSVVNYREALAHLLNEAPGLEDYLKKFLVVLTGDFPTWKYNKIIAEVCYALNHIQIPTAKTRQNWSPKKGTSFKDLSESDYYLVKGSGREESGIIFSLPLTFVQYQVVITLYYFIGQWDPLREPASSVPSFTP